jgi:uncharacterized protein involved in outer membrane biogenesis
VLFAGIFIVLATLDVNQYKGLVEEQAAAATGRTLKIEGDMELAVSLSPAIVINGVRFQNADWGSREDMAVIQRVEESIQLIPAIFGDIQVTRLALVGPDILLERNSQGQANCEFTSAAPADPAAAEGEAAALAVSAIELDNGTFAFKDAQAGSNLTATLERLRVNISGDLTAPDIRRMTLQGLSANADGTELVVSALEMAPVSGGTEISLEAELDGQELTADGEIGALSRIIAMDGEFPAKLDLGFGPFALSTDLMVDLSGARPSLTGSVTADTIDLTQLPPAPEEAAGDKLFPSDPLPMDALTAADVDLDVSVNRLILQKDLALTDLKNKIVLKNGRLTNNQTANLGGGSISSDVTMAAPAGTLSIKASGSGMQAQQIAVDLDATDLITQGPLDFDVDLQGTGKSVAAMMASLDGAIVGGMGEARIRNDAINLAGADFLTQLISSINPFVAQEEFTVAQCAVVNLRVQDGIARTEQGIAFVSDRMEITSSGNINFAEEKLDLNIRPKAKEGLGVGMGKLTQMVKVSGPLNSPGIGLDAAGAVRSLGSIAGAFATGGASLLAEGMLERGQTAGDTCETARTWHLAGN